MKLPADEPIHVDYIVLSNYRRLRRIWVRLCPGVWWMVSQKEGA